jgi:hypothetical protein
MAAYLDHELEAAQADAVGHRVRFYAAVCAIPHCEGPAVMPTSRGRPHLASKRVSCATLRSFSGLTDSIAQIAADVQPHGFSDQVAAAALASVAGEEPLRGANRHQAI